MRLVITLSQWLGTKHSEEVTLCPRATSSQQDDDGVQPIRQRMSPETRSCAPHPFEEITVPINLRP
jgi:hypothetical protein